MTDTRTTKFRRIYNATVTPGALIEDLTSATGTRYVRMQGATVTNKKGDQTRTVMAFGKSFDATRALLVSGTPVELSIQDDGGSVRIIGLKREPAAAAA